MELKVKKMRPEAILPTRGSKEAAAVDLYACIPGSMTLTPGATAKIPSGIACDFPEGYFGMVFPRSSVGTKRHLVLANTSGIIDNDYKGEIIMVFTNTSRHNQTIEPGERLAQMILLPYVTYDIIETDELSETERGAGGFGSTGR